MRKKPGENESCPCGSGKKYKDCCKDRQDNPTSTGKMPAEKILAHYREKITLYAYKKYSSELTGVFAKWMDDWELHLEDETLVKSLFMMWAIYNYEIDNGDTVFLKYLKKEQMKMNRDAVSHLSGWEENCPSLYQALDFQGRQGCLLQDIFTGEKQLVTFPCGNLPREKGTMLTTMVARVGDTLLSYDETLELEPVFHEDLEDSVQEIYREQVNSGSVEKDDWGALLKTFYPDLLGHIYYLAREVKEFMEVGELPWDDQSHKEIAITIANKLKGNYSRQEVNTGIVLWHTYVNSLDPPPVKLEVMVGAVEYWVAKLFGHQGVTFNRLAHDYRVPARKISHLAREIMDVFENEYSDYIKKFARELDSQKGDAKFKVSLGQRISKLTPTRKAAKDPRQQALELLAQAQGKEGREMEQLVHKALKLYPYLPEAYLLLRENARDLEEETRLCRRGVLAGEKELGELFIKKNRGLLWEFMEARSYLRVKYEYASCLWDLEKSEEALKEYYEILELNHNDEQGVRFALLTALIEERKYTEAARLIKKYRDDWSANFAYNQVLLDYALNGLTANTRNLFREAKKRNPYIPKYLLGKKKIPVSFPPYVGIGDEGEAVLYAMEHIHLWRRETPLMEWLRSTS